ncbi:U6 small nuclear RNA (adenine-(43)-N(6))-methyltransferase [Gryllus bimaculatus]|nr:U6 small nuclear RNA (adenine-(43)-N(6))-methyltransferase [Gryllus bimaculatus]
MSQNKFMHPRNIYKHPPSFKDMAIKYPEFRKFAKPDISGKITLDFKDPEALRALTQTLLLKDFDLNVNIPLTRLVPTLPLRLNYLLWIEDLLDAVGIQRSDFASVKGIDIGTGASCIYPLLAAKQNNWSMMATEVDNESFKIAEANVTANNLQHLITVKLVEGSKLLTNILEEDKNYTFSMCNPPFFSSEDDLDFTSKSRSPCRPPPHNGITGDLKELVAPGGEVAFILKMMDESKELGQKIKIYTTMIGHKSSLAVLKLELTKLNVASLTETRFCQGKTTRWGIAWTYDKNLTLQKAYQTPSQKKSNTPMTYIVPSEVVSDATMYTVEVISEKVITLLTEIQIKHKLKKKNKFMTMIEATALKNTWSHQRRKKRQADKLGDHSSSLNIEEKDVNANKFEESCINFKRGTDDFNQEEMTNKKMKIEQNDSAKAISPSENFVLDYNSSDSKINNEKCSTGDVDESLKPKSNEESSTIPLLETTIFIRSIASEIHVEILWRGGTGGRESMHQVLQYIKNKLK